MSYRSEIKEAYDSWADKIEQIAEQAHKEVVVPYCKKHDLLFLAGNGTWFFCQGINGLGFSDEIDAQQLGFDPDEFLEVFQVLMMEVDHISVLGEWMNDYRPDLEE